MAGTEKRHSTEQRNIVTMGVAATQDSTFEWRELGAQVKPNARFYPLGAPAGRPRHSCRLATSIAPWEFAGPAEVVSHVTRESPNRVPGKLDF
jgi:hypothetical protein